MPILDKAGELLNHIKSVKRFILTDDEISLFAKTTIINTMLSGRLCSSFPPAVVEDIMLFLKERISEGEETALIGLETKSRGLIVFQYYIRSGNNGISLVLEDYYVPSSPSQVAVPPGSEGKCLVINVETLE